MIGPVETFQTEAREHLEVLENSLLDLEKDASNLELVNRAFRSIHTIKGGAGMFGFNQLTDFTHHVENLLDRLRVGELSVSPSLIGTLLDIGDFIAQLLDDVAFSEEQSLRAESFVTAIGLVMGGATESSEMSMNKGSESKGIGDGDNHLFRVIFTPDKHSYKAGLDVVPILRELHELGKCHVTTKLKDLPDNEEFDSETNYLSFDCVLVTTHDQSVVLDVFMFVIDDWAVNVDEIDLADEDPESDRVGELLVERGLLSQADIKNALAEKSVIGNLLAKSGLVTEEDVSSALFEQDATRQLKKQSQEAANANIRVPASKLDSLMNLVGELVIVQARLNQFATNSDNEEILSIAEELDLLTNQMRDETFGIRLVPIGSTFGRFRRLVRDLSVELHKSIELKTEGAETELDKMVIDKLSDPLIHIIRNSIDHGIETPDERQKLSKPSNGTIFLKAQHAESHVLITISDDGKGLDPEKIREKALSKGIISPNDDLSDEQLQSLIFEPGFSTASQISDISGRGVGMDVVKRSIQELGGKVVLKSNVGQGTDIRISLPMTLAIIEGLLVKVGEEHFVLPLNSVEECIELPENITSSSRHIIVVRGQQIPYISLRDHFDVGGIHPSIEQVVVLHNESERFGFCVDEVVGQYQTVIKRLGRFYEGVVGFSGATIMGDGNVAIVLDPQSIIESTTF
jgi:two-component system, chemotaxis family, sensor kinase CheA